MVPVLSVSEFIKQINGLIAGEFIVEGEVTGYNFSQGKYIFFGLKDETALVNCFAWPSKITAPLEDGMKIRVTGYPEVFAKYGKFTINVQRAEVVGEGSLKRAYLLLKEKLTKEGLFDESRKRPLPELPQRIGVIASRDSAAFGDFKRILNNRWGGLQIVLRHVQVQGEGAVQDIVKAFVEFNEHPEPCEVLVLIRGGGSLEELSAFNSEEVARAVAGSRLPVVCGVGHERDESLADFAADVRASTPSNAAELVVSDRYDFAAQLDFQLQNALQNMEHAAARRRHQIEMALQSVLGRFEALFAQGRHLLEKFIGVFAGLENIFSRKREFVLAGERLLRNVDPRRVLRRGYSIARNQKGEIVRRRAQVGKGERFVVELSEGELWGQAIQDKNSGQKTLPI